MTTRKAGTGTVTIVSVGCCWKGCEETHIYPEGTSVGNIPEGWRLLVLAQSSPYNREFVINADIAGHICPKHWKELLGYLQTGEEMQNPKKRKKAYEYQKYLYEKVRQEEE